MIYLMPMKLYAYGFIIIAITLKMSCNSNQNDEKGAKGFDCNLLTDKSFVYGIATSLIQNHDNDNIWNLNEIDTTDFFTIEDFFTNSTTKSRLVLTGGVAGMSSGSADNLLLLFDCSDTSRVIWSGQMGDFTQDDIIDINNDGIKEIIGNSGMMWMGECNESYYIFNFKGGTKNYLFTANSRSVIDCGGDNVHDAYEIGDTLESIRNCSLQKQNDGRYSVVQLLTFKIHNGGKNDAEILNGLRVVSDTTLIELK